MRFAKPWAGRAVAIALFASSCTAGDPADRHTTNSSGDRLVEYATVVKVIDGDTMVITVDARRETVRLIGVDAPETVHPTKGVQCFGPEASHFLARLLPPGTTLRIERDDEARDAFNRLLLYAFLATPRGERMINFELVVRGFALPLEFAPNLRYRELIAAANDDAKQHRRGLWRTCK